MNPDLDYVLGAAIGPLSIVTQQNPPPGHVENPAPAKTRVAGQLVSATPDQVVLSSPAFDDSTSVGPVETRLYLAPAGQPIPSDGPGWVASAYLFSTSSEAVTSAGAASYPLAIPAGPVGDYFAQVVHGFPKS